MTGTSYSSVYSEFLREHLPPDDRLVLVTLNWRLPADTLAFWNKAQLRLCADGDVEDFYREQGKTEFTNLAEDQDSTDLEKCLTCARQHVASHADAFPKRCRTTLLVLGAFGGRLDHTLGNLSVLFANPEADRATPVVLLGEEGNIARCIPRGRTVIHPCREHEGPQCGLLTISGPATCTFTGLKWNLENAKMEMGGLLSTCNVIEEDLITIDTDTPLLWITQLRT
ncbi:hypothetical protein WJX73_001041 [Symbiochloris irregularis]|uniref:thiamine diphosphokinase n=1 Tax=Symbiochloris irregularis TaxID=706552 RepID=A0AAW1NWF4_9CHLO